MTYKVFHIGGNPKRIAFLADELSRMIDDLQNCGWEIDGVDLINNTRAWDSGKQMYVETPEYIIRAKKEEEKYIKGLEPVKKESIPYLMHKEMDIPISECQKAYDIAMEYLRRQGKLKG